MDLAHGDRRLSRASSSASARRRSAARLLGLGIANYVESSIGSPHERTEITVKPDGVVDVVIGTQPSGQGHETSFAQVVADLIAVPVAAINVIIGDTDIVSVGGGSHSGRSMRHAGTVIAKAVPDLIAKGKADRGAGAQRAGGQGRVQGRPVLVADQQPQLRFPGAGQGGRAAHAAARTEGRPRGRCRQRDARSGVPERLRDLRGRDRSRHRRARAHPLRRGRRRRPLHQSADRPRPDAWRHRAGRGAGAVGAVLR